ncbi:MAG: hypothetical protein AAGG57_19780 [Pseudomonadota bacterium]
MTLVIWPLLILAATLFLVIVFIAVPESGRILVASLAFALMVLFFITGLPMLRYAVVVSWPSGNDRVLAWIADLDRQINEPSS